MSGLDLKPLVIIGAGGFGREVAWLVNDINKQKPEWDLLGFLDDSKNGRTIEGYPVIGKTEDVFSITPIPWCAIAIADAGVRKEIADKIQAAGIKLATLIHPSVIMSDYVSIEEGTIICAGTIITTNVTLGKCCIVNPGSFIGHDTVLGDYVSMMPAANLAGEVTVGQGTYFGLNTCVINRISVGAWSIIGAGAVVANDIPDKVTAVGVPARVIKTLSKKGE